MYQQHWGGGGEACKSRFADNSGGIKKARDACNGKDDPNIEDISMSRDARNSIEAHYILKPERKKQKEYQQQQGYQQE